MDLITFVIILFIISTTWYWYPDIPLMYEYFKCKIEDFVDYLRWVFKRNKIE